MSIVFSIHTRLPCSSCTRSNQTHILLTWLAPSRLPLPKPLYHFLHSGTLPALLLHLPSSRRCAAGCSCAAPACCCTRLAVPAEPGTALPFSPARTVITAHELLARLVVTKLQPRRRTLLCNTLLLLLLLLLYLSVCPLFCHVACCSCAAPASCCTRLSVPAERGTARPCCEGTCCS
jgi:hypothetical protein